MIVRFFARISYKTGSILGHLLAKFMLGFQTFYDPEAPGGWKED